MSFTLLQVGTARVKYLAVLQRLDHADVSKSIFWNASQLLCFHHNESSNSLNKNTCWSNIKISSYFNFWKLDCFSGMVFLKNIFDVRKILDDKPFMFFFVNPANHLEMFSEVLKLDMDPGYILLNINPIPIREIPTRAFPVWVSYVANLESLSTKIVVARLQVIRFEIKAWKHCFH